MNKLAQTRWRFIKESSIPQLNNDIAAGDLEEALKSLNSLYGQLISLRAAIKADLKAPKGHHPLVR